VQIWSKYNFRLWYPYFHGSFGVSLNYLGLSLFVRSIRRSRIIRAFWKSFKLCMILRFSSRVYQSLSCFDVSLRLGSLRFWFIQSFWLLCFWLRGLFRFWYIFDFWLAFNKDCFRFRGIFVRGIRW
jgi:hypothetical protein